ncbi:hypothetical protein SK128_015057, partial [Halocaridina rubra]
MAAETLERAFEVIDSVSHEIADSLGTIACEQLDLDRLFARAENYLQHGLSVEEAKASIVLSILPDIEKSLSDRKREGSRHIVSEKKPLGKEVIQTYVENGLENSDGCKYAINEKASTSDSSLPVDKDYKVFPVIEPLELDDLATRDLLVQNDEDKIANTLRSKTVDKSFDDDIAIITPPTRSPAPLIDITDEKTDESSRPSSCNSVVSVAKELQPVRERDSRENAFCNIQVNPSKKSLHCSEMHKELSCDEQFLDTKSTLSTAETLVHNCERSDTSDLIDFIEEDVTYQSYGSKYTDQNSNESCSSAEVLNCKDYSHKKDMLRDYGKNGDVDSLDSSLSSDDPTDVLWKDAQYVCSLLPYFTLADVHQSLIDNFYHPDRKTVVLEAYVELAYELDEVVPESVLLTLSAAKKRPYEESSDGSVWPGKKMKTDEGSKKSKRDNLTDDGVIPIPSGKPADVGESFPSTSRELVPNKIYPVPVDRTVVVGPHLSLDEGDPPKDLSSKNSEGMAEINNTLVVRPVVTASNGAAKTDCERKKWCAEKIEFISAVIGNVDIDTLLANVEACNSDDDVEVLLARLLEENNAGNQLLAESPQSPLEPSAFQSVEQGATNSVTPADPVVSENDSAVAGPSSESEENPNDVEDRISAHVATLSEMFNDADPDYIRDRCSMIFSFIFCSISVTLPF